MEFGSLRLCDGRVTMVDGALEGALASLVTFPESETPLQSESAIMDALVPTVTAGEDAVGLGEWLEPVVATGGVWSWSVRTCFLLNFHQHDPFDPHELYNLENDLAQLSL